MKKNPITTEYYKCNDTSMCGMWFSREIFYLRHHMCRAVAAAAAGKQTRILHTELFVNIEGLDDHLSINVILL